MAAVNQRPGAFVLAVADIGKDVLSTFTQFVLSRKVVDHRLETLLATISITTSLLVALGSTINKYENDYHVEDQLTRPTCETCKSDFERLIAMSEIAKEKGGWITESPGGSQPIAMEVDPWFVFNVTLGQGEKANKFWSRLNQTRQTLDALNDSIKYKIFKKLEQENRLNPKQAEELKNLTTLVPRMVQTLEWTEKEKKKEKQKDAPKTVKSSRKRPDVGEKDDFAEFIENAKADALSEDTMIDPEKDEVLDEKTKKQVKFLDEEDQSSVSSTALCERYSYNNTKVIYEEWILTYHGPRSTVRSSIGFMGIKFKAYDEDNEHWDIEPELRSQGELQSAYKNAVGTLTECKYRASVDKALKAFPEHARDLVDWLIEDRTDSTNNERYIRQWSVIAVRPKEKHAYHSGKKLIKSVKGSDWLIMIKGETVGKVERRRPDRWEDPWRQPNKPRRYYPRHYDRFEDREDKRHRPHYEEYNEYMPRPPVRLGTGYEREEGRLAGEDEDPLDGTYMEGMVHVGMFESREDAERRMDKVLDDMAGKVTA